MALIRNPNSRLLRRAAVLQLIGVPAVIPPPAIWEAPCYGARCRAYEELVDSERSGFHVIVSHDEFDAAIRLLARKRKLYQAPALIIKNHHIFVGASFLAEDLGTGFSIVFSPGDGGACSAVAIEVMPEGDGQLTGVVALPNGINQSVPVGHLSCQLAGAKVGGIDLLVIVRAVPPGLGSVGAQPAILVQVHAVHFCFYVLDLVNNSAAEAGQRQLIQVQPIVGMQQFCPLVEV